MGAIEDMGFGDRRVGVSVPRGPVEAVSDEGSGYVVDELIDLEIGELRDQPYGEEIQNESMTEKVKQLLGRHVSDPVHENAMVNYIADWLIADAKAQSPTEIIRLLDALDKATARETGKRSGLVSRIYQHALHARARARARP